LGYSEPLKIKEALFSFEKYAEKRVGADNKFTGRTAWYTL